MAKADSTLLVSTEPHIVGAPAGFTVTATIRHLDPQGNVLGEYVIRGSA